MSAEANKEAVRRLAKEGWSEHKLSVFDDFTARRSANEQEGHILRHRHQAVRSREVR